MFFLTYLCICCAHCYSNTYIASSAVYWYINGVVIIHHFIIFGKRIWLKTSWFYLWFFFKILFCKQDEKQKGDDKKPVLLTRSFLSSMTEDIVLERYFPVQSYVEIDVNFFWHWEIFEKTGESTFFFFL